MEFQFLVTHGVTKRLVRSTSNNARDIKTAIRKAFGIIPSVTITVQKYYQDWSEYIDLDDDELLENKARLMVITSTIVDLKTLQSPISTTSSPSLSAELFDMGSVTETSLSGDCFETQSMLSEPSVSDTGSDEATQPGSSSETKQSEKEWPASFVLPAHLFPLDLQIALNKKKVLDSNLRHKLVNAVFEEMRTYTWCPHSYMYEDAARAIICAYPYLADKIPLCKPYETWKRRLGDKFRNERKLIRQRGEEDAVGIPKMKKRKELQTKDAEMEYPPGEDESSFKAHIKTIQAESKKRNPEKAKVSRLMKITYRNRRLLLEKGIAVEQLIHDYPCLVWKMEMLEEVSRITGVDMTDCYAAFAEKLGVVAPLLVSKSKKPVSDCVLSSALLALPGLLRERSSAIMATDEEKDVTDTETETEDKNPVYPHIILSSNGHYKIMCEGIQVAEATTLPEAWYFLVIVYFVYDMLYPKEARNTLTFVEVKFFSLDRKVRMTRPTMRLLNELTQATQNNGQSNPLR